MKKLALVLAAVLALSATSAMACPSLSMTQIDLSAGSSVLAGGGTSNKTGYVTSGAYDASLATASQHGNTVTTFTTTGGAAFTNSPKNAGGQYLGGATATISTQKFSLGGF